MEILGSDMTTHLATMTEIVGMTGVTVGMIETIGVMTDVTSAETIDVIGEMTDVTNTEIIDAAGVTATISGLGDN